MIPAIPAAIITAITIYAAYWRRCKGGGWWEQDAGPWWAADGLIYLWLFVPLAGALYGVGVPWWKALILSGLSCAAWNPGHAGLALGRDPGETERARKKPIAALVIPIVNLIAEPDTARWCIALLSLDYAVRTLVIGAAGAYLLTPAFGMYAAAGLLTGPIYGLGWAVYDRGWRPVFLQPRGQGGHLIAEWINCGWLTGALATLAWAIC